MFARAFQVGARGVHAKSYGAPMRIIGNESRGNGGKSRGDSKGFHDTKDPYKSGDSRFLKRALVVGSALAAAPLFGHWDKKAENVEKTVPGEPETWKSRAGETIAEVVQSHAPINEFHTHLTDIACTCLNPDNQFPVHLYVSHVNEDFMQAVVMDSDQKDARLIGIEYIVTEKLFNLIPPEERKYWHSHQYEAKSGLLVAPRMPMVAEHKLMKDLAPTYGKAFTMWNKDQDSLPFGLPELLVVPTKDEEVRVDVLLARDEQLGISSAREKKNRADIPKARVLDGADALQNGEVVQLEAKILRN